MLLNIFSCAFGHLYIFFGEVSIEICCPLFDWAVWFFNIELLERSLLFWSIGCIICKHFLPWGLFFIWFMISFVVKKFLSLTRFHVFIFIFISLEDDLEMILTATYFRVFCLCFPLKVFFPHLFLLVGG